MQAGGGATGQAAVFGGGDGVVGLQLVEFDTGFEQGFAVFDVAKWTAATSVAWASWSRTVTSTAVFDELVKRAHA